MNNFVWGNNMKKIIAVGFIVILILCLSLVAISCTSIASKTYKGEYCGRTCSITVNFYTGEWSYSGAEVMSSGRITVLSSYNTISLSGNMMSNQGEINGRTEYALRGNANVNFRIYVDSDQQTLLIGAYGTSTGIKCTLSN